MAPIRVKNMTPAPIQRTADHILGEAREGQEPESRLPKENIADPSELADYRLRKRKEFEDHIRCVRLITVKHASWEESQKDFARARSVWERALQVDYKNHALWVKYAEFEMKNKFINHARNIWDRAVTGLPRVDQLWYKYVHMEEMIGNVTGARRVFERWMDWIPDMQGWLSYVNFELRYGEVDRARGIFERFVSCHPVVSAWIQYAEFEMKNGAVAKARGVYERAVDLLSDDEEVEALFMAFVEFEERCKETERARCICNYALDHIPKGRGEDLYWKFVAFEKQYGDKEGIEDAIVGKRRFQYEQEVRKNPLNYDSWFDYIRLEESVGKKEMIREVYERAIVNVPLAEEKRYWRRYIYLWACLNLIPHKKFSFAKVWLLAAQFELRQKNLKGARLILGNAIGMAPKDKIFKKYVEIELQLGQIDRCRILYEKYLEWAPANCFAWNKYTELEISLSETDRARAIFELAIAQPALDMPELLRKVWISYAKFEASIAMEEEDQDTETRTKNDAEHRMKCIQRCRDVFERALDHFRTSSPELKEERAMLLEEWLNMENSFGSLGDVSIVQKKMPRKVKRKRAIQSEDGNPAGYEECIDYIFPDEVARPPNLKILEAAYKWKKQKAGSQED